MAMKKTETIKYPIAKVTWIDAEEIGETGWNDLKEAVKKAKEPCPTMCSVGYVVHENDHHVALLSTIGPDVCSTLEKIPMSFVVKIEYLEVKDAKV